ncbi:Serine acetyltransferase [Paraglaciecola mesophila]|uniref:Serine acetyltransferase n=1 Tax=Paraglaciecola mesophila TaxID=197222 RepID=A0A857JMC9_9ALTE|nr:serine O-acetyltransferase [Paraglaciecola mesophila]QHJ12161.1 Serine acetyltransferase [Paraglaciecola mesophila]
MDNKFWQTLRNEAQVMTDKEPLLATYVNECILKQEDFAGALSFILSNKLSDKVMSADALRTMLDQAYCEQPLLVEATVFDIQATFERDPAVKSYLTVLLYFKGFHAIQVHRFAHMLWLMGRHELALFIQSRSSEVLSVDIHPAAYIGQGVMFDHATGIVVGETAVIEDNVSIMQSVTLGGTGNEVGDRHPKVRHGVMIGAGAKILGNIEIGSGAKVGAGSVVLANVPSHVTVAGVPAKIVGKPSCQNPCQTMRQNVLED